MREFENRKKRQRWTELQQVELLRQYYHEHKSVNEIARTFKVSSRQLQRLIKKSKNEIDIQSRLLQ